MAFIAHNQLDQARTYVKKYCETNEVKSDFGYCNMLLSQLRRTGGYMLELPSDVQNLLFKEDVSCTFIPERYYVSEREAVLTERILRKNRSAQRLGNAGINYLNATLLYGESGTGKTQFGRYLAYTIGVPFCYSVKRRFSIKHEVKVFSPEELLQMSERFLADVKAHADFRVEYDREDLARYCASGVKQSEVIDTLTESLAAAVETDSDLIF